MMNTSEDLYIFSLKMKGGVSSQPLDDSIGGSLEKCSKNIVDCVSYAMTTIRS